MDDGDWFFKGDLIRARFRCADCLFQVGEGGYVHDTNVSCDLYI